MWGKRDFFCQLGEAKEVFLPAVVLSNYHVLIVAPFIDLPHGTGVT